MNDKATTNSKDMGLAMGKALDLAVGLAVGRLDVACRRAYNGARHGACRGLLWNCLLYTSDAADE